MPLVVQHPIIPRSVCQTQEECGLQVTCKSPLPPILSFATLVAIQGVLQRDYTYHPQTPTGNCFSSLSWRKGAVVVLLGAVGSLVVVAWGPSQGSATLCTIKIANAANWREYMFDRVDFKSTFCNCPPKMFSHVGRARVESASASFI